MLCGKRFLSLSAAWLLASALLGQGLTTTATKDDWEEINFDSSSTAARPKYLISGELQF